MARSKLEPHDVFVNSEPDNQNILGLSPKRYTQWNSKLNDLGIAPAQGPDHIAFTCHIDLNLAICIAFYYFNLSWNGPRPLPVARAQSWARST